MLITNGDGVKYTHALINEILKPAETVQQQQLLEESLPSFEFLAFLFSHDILAGSPQRQRPHLLA